MKKNLFILTASSLLILGGLAFTTCDDDDPDPTPPVETAGKKLIVVQVVNESDQATSADVAITKDGAGIPSVTVAGTYSYDVTTASSGTVYKFTATKNGYIQSGEETITLNYANSSESVTSTVKLQITKKGDPVTLKPGQDNNFNVPAPTSTGGTVKVNVPAGAVDRAVTLTPTSIPTAASKGTIAADSPNGSFSLKTIDLESDWSGSFLNGQKATFTFPLTQDLINATVKNGKPLLFGSNSSGQWESYPVTVNEAALTGTVSIPHFSRWYLTTEIYVSVTTTQTPFETLGTGGCGAPLTAGFVKANTGIPAFFKQALGSAFIAPEAIGSHSEDAIANKSWAIQGRCFQKTVTVTGLNIPTFTYFHGPVTFSSTATSCTHNGGSGG